MVDHGLSLFASVPLSGAAVIRVLGQANTLSPHPHRLPIESTLESTVQMYYEECPLTSGVARLIRGLAPPLRSFERHEV